MAEPILQRPRIMLALRGGAYAVERVFIPHFPHNAHHRAHTDTEIRRDRPDAFALCARTADCCDFPCISILKSSAAQLSAFSAGASETGQDALLTVMAPAAPLGAAFHDPVQPRRLTGRGGLLWRRACHFLTISDTRTQSDAVRFFRLASEVDPGFGTG